MLLYKLKHITNKELNKILMKKEPGPVLAPPRLYISANFVSLTPVTVAILEALHYHFFHSLKGCR